MCLSGLKIITAFVAPYENAWCFRTLCIPSILSRLHTIAPDVRGVLSNNPPEMLAVLALFLHKFTLKYLAYAGW